jgi:hypothetical protein
MSGYLANLVARAAGPPPAAVSPRLAPLFPVGRPQQSDELPSLEPARGSPGGSWSPDLDPGNTFERRRVRSDDESAGRDVSGAPAKSPASVEPARAPQATERQAPVRAVAPARVESTERRGPEGHPAAVEPRTAADTHVEVRVEPSRATGPPPGKQRRLSPAQPVVAARPRFSTPLPTRPATTAATSERPPRIEVQIGRVEIRRPSTPEPFQWPVPAAAPQASTGFGELAAARRYVDRGWG